MAINKINTAIKRMKRRHKKHAIRSVCNRQKFVLDFIAFFKYKEQLKNK